MFAGFYTLPAKAFQATMTYEKGHEELPYIPRDTIVRVFNDSFWSPIAQKVPGIN